jgi:hypothetical protein
MLPYHYTTKGFNRVSDCTSALRVFLAQVNPSQADQALDKILQLLFALRTSHIGPLQTALRKLKLPPRPANALEADGTISGVIPTTKGKSKELTEVEKAHYEQRVKIVSDACRSPAAASKALVANMTNEVTRKPVEHLDAFGWALLQRTSLQWRTVEPKTRGRHFLRMANMAVIEHSFVSAYRANLVHTGNVAELRAKILEAMREATGDPEWSYVDSPITSIKPTASATATPAPKKSADAEDTSRPRRKTRKVHEVDPDPSDEDISPEEPHETQIRRLIRVVEQSTVALHDGKQGNPIEGHVAASFKRFVQVTAFHAKFI